MARNFEDHPLAVSASRPDPRTLRVGSMLSLASVPSLIWLCSGPSFSCLPGTCALQVNTLAVIPPRLCQIIDFEMLSDHFLARVKLKESRGLEVLGGWGRNCRRKALQRVEREEEQSGSSANGGRESDELTEITTHPRNQSPAAAFDFLKQLPRLLPRLPFFPRGDQRPRAREGT